MKKLLALLLIVVLTLGAFVSCEDYGTTVSTASTHTEDSTQVNEAEAMDISNNSVGKEMRRSEKIQSHLTEVQPQEFLDWSLERDNILRRTKLWNDKNKVSYIYLLGNNGNVITYHTIKGKVSSVNSALSTPLQIVKDPNAWFQSRMDRGMAGDGTSLILPSPQEDGSYGTNGDAIFFFTTSGAYIEWNGDYYLSDVPMRLNVQPIMVEQIEDEVEEDSDED